MVAAGRGRQRAKRRRDGAASAAAPRVARPSVVRRSAGAGSSDAGLIFFHAGGIVLLILPSSFKLDFAEALHRDALSCPNHLAC